MLVLAAFSALFTRERVCARESLTWVSPLTYLHCYIHCTSSCVRSMAE